MKHPEQYVILVHNLRGILYREFDAKIATLKKEDNDPEYLKWVKDQRRTVSSCKTLSQVAEVFNQLSLSPAFFVAAVAEALGGADLGQHIRETDSFPEDWAYYH